MPVFVYFDDSFDFFDNRAVLVMGLACLEAESGIKRNGSHFSLYGTEMFELIGVEVISSRGPYIGNEKIGDLDKKQLWAEESFSNLYVLQVPIDNLRAMCRQIDEGKRFEEQIAKKNLLVVQIKILNCTSGLRKGYDKSVTVA